MSHRSSIHHEGTKSTKNGEEFLPCPRVRPSCSSCSSWSALTVQRSLAEFGHHLEVRPRMLADRAPLGRLEAGVDVAAVPAPPRHGLALLEDGAVLDGLQEELVPLLVRLLDRADALEDLGDLLEPFRRGLPWPCADTWISSPRPRRRPRLSGSRSCRRCRAAPGSAAWRAPSRSPPSPGRSPRPARNLPSWPRRRSRCTCSWLATRPANASRRFFSVFVPFKSAMRSSFPLNSATR